MPDRSRKHVAWVAAGVVVLVAVGVLVWHQRGARCRDVHSTYNTYNAQYQSAEVAFKTDDATGRQRDIDSINNAQTLYGNLVRGNPSCFSADVRAKVGSGQ